MMNHTTNGHRQTSRAVARPTGYLYRCSYCGRFFTTRFRRGKRILCSPHCPGLEKRKMEIALKYWREAVKHRHGSHYANGISPRTWRHISQRTGISLETLKKLARMEAGFYAKKLGVVL